MGVTDAQVELEGIVATLEAERPFQTSLNAADPDGDPVIYCVNTLPLAILTSSLAERIVDDPAISEPLYEFLDKECGQWLEYHASTIWPALATDCNMLEPVCHPLSPVLVIEETGFNSSALPILHSREIYPDAFMRFEMIRRRGRFVDRD